MRTLKLVGGLLIGLALLACDSQTPAGSSAAGTAGGDAAPAAASASLDAAVMQKWSRSCALCHVTGNAGAPRVGNAGEWRDRLTQSTGVLLTHTIEGFNDMPPLGYCMSCERGDFIAMIDFMAGSETGEAP